MKKQDGFGLVEVLVSILVLTLILAAVSRLQIDNRKFMVGTRLREEAVQIASQILDSLQRQGMNAVDKGKRIVEIQDPKIKREYTVEWDTSSYDVTALGAAIGMRVNVEISWKAPNKADTLRINGVLR